jgi:Xaa-Pro aminopeptidase
MESLLRETFPKSSLRDATLMYEDLKAVLTPKELQELRRSCAIAGDAFAAAAPLLHVGVREYEAAGLVRDRLELGMVEGRRCGGFAYCMSGPNAARAWAAYQVTGDRAFEADDVVLLHCNSYRAGMWTDITRTFSLGESDQFMRAAVFDARAAAIAAIRPGVEGRAVDRAAREVFEARGFGQQFRHATGHGVGFMAINHDARPRIHPLSHDVLETGMVFNVEPAVYIDGVCGMRHCDMVAVTCDGAELLTPFE